MRRQTQAKPNANPPARSASQLDPHLAHSATVQAVLSEPFDEEVFSARILLGMAAVYPGSAAWIGGSVWDRRKQLDELILAEVAKFLAQTTNDRTYWLANRDRQ